MNIFGRFWSVSVDLCYLMSFLVNSVNFWSFRKILIHFVSYVTSTQFWSNLVNFDKSRLIKIDFGQFRSMLADKNRFWSISINFGRLLSIFVDFGQYRLILILVDFDLGRFRFCKLIFYTEFNYPLVKRLRAIIHKMTEVSEAR